MAETYPTPHTGGPAGEAVYEAGPSPLEIPSVLEPRDWRIMKQTDLPTIEQQIVEGTQMLGNPAFFFNNLPDMLPGGRRTVGRPKELLESGHERLGRDAVRLGDPEEWSEEQRLLRSDHIKGMTNGQFFDELKTAAQLVGEEQIAGLSAEDFQRLNGLRTIGKLQGDDLRKHHEFEVEVYKRLRQEPFAFSHDDLWH